MTNLDSILLIVVLEKTLESPLDFKEIEPVDPMPRQQMQVQSLVWELGAHTPQSRKPKCTSVQLSPLECQSRTNTRVQDVQKIPE